MDKFLVRVPKEEHHVAVSCNPTKRRKRVASLPWQVQRERDGRVSPSVLQGVARASLADCSEIARYTQVWPVPAELGSEAAAGVWGRATPARPARPDPRESFVASLAFDTGGALLASVGSGGCLAVHDWEGMRNDAYQSSARYISLGGGDEERYHQVPSGTLHPLVRVETGRALECVTWNPADQNEVAVCARDGLGLGLYDLTVCEQAATHTLAAPAQRPGESLGWSRQGVTDVQYFQAGGRYTAAAASRSGEVWLWDRRAGRAPRSVLGRGGGGAVPPGLTSVQLAPDGVVVYAGSTGGEICCWDLRAGREQKSGFAAIKEVKHPLLHSISISGALGAVPGLAAQADVKASSIDSLAMDPRDSRRLAFHLGGGWSGVLDLGRLEVTHAHCPPPLWEEELEGGGAWAGRLHKLPRRRPAWAPSSSSYLAGGWRGQLHVLDFAVSPKARCWVAEGREEAEEPPPEEAGEEAAAVQGEEGGDEPGRLVRAGGRGSRGGRGGQGAAVALSAPAVAVAVHPLTDDVVAGTIAGDLAVLAAP